MPVLELLAEREPRLRFVETWNGETNAHMVAINEALGFSHPRRVTAWLLPTESEPAPARAATTALAR